MQNDTTRTDRVQQISVISAPITETHVSTEQHLIVTTEDKLRRWELEYGRYLGKQDGWIAPLSVCLTLLVALEAAPVREPWEAVFRMGLGAASAWLFVALRDSFKAVTVNHLIATMRGDSGEGKD